MLLQGAFAATPPLLSVSAIATTRATFLLLLILFRLPIQLLLQGAFAAPPTFLSAIATTRATFLPMILFLAFLLPLLQGAFASLSPTPAPSTLLSAIATTQAMFQVSMQ